MKRTNETPAVYAISINEIIFAQKNKAYGAYLLRKNYAKHMTAALLLSLAIFTAFSVASLILNRTDGPAPTNVPSNKPIYVDILPTVNNAPADAVKPVEPVKAFKQTTIKFLVPVVKPDAPDVPEMMPTVIDLKEAEPWTITQKGNENGLDLTSVEIIPTDEPVKRQIVDDRPDEAPVMYAEEMPAYPGGEGELLSFISRNVHYPEIAMKAGVEGRVMVQFIVEKDGSLSRIEVIKSIGAGCDEEAVRVCKLMKGWHAGMQNGRAVRVKMVIPFMFRLQ